MKLKFFTTLVSLFVCASASSFAAGQTFYFDIYKAQLDLGKSFNLSDTLGTSGNNYWYSDTALSKNVETRPTLADFTNSENSFVFARSANQADKSTFSQYSTITIDSNIDVALWSAGGGAAGLTSDTGAVFKFNDNATVKIGTLQIGTNYNYKFVGGNITVQDVKKVTSGANGSVSLGSLNSPISSLNVEGTFHVYGHTSQAYPTTFYLSSSDANEIPTAKINVLDGVGKVNSGRLVYGSSSTTSALNQSAVVSVNAVVNSAGFLVAGSSKSEGVVTYVFTTNADAYTDKTASTNGMIWQGGYSYVSNVDTYSYLEGSAKIALVMRSGKFGSDGNFTYLNHTQAFTGEQLYWSGGVKMESGTLLVNYNATMQGDSTHDNHGDLTLARADGATETIFGSCGAVVDKSAQFAFKDLVVEKNGGTIRVRLDRDVDALIYDALKFTGSAKLGKGVENATVTILFADNGSDALEGNLALLVSDVHTVDETTKDAWTKLISWEAVAEDGIGFDAADLKDSAGNTTHTFQTFNASDGLYVAYVAVPEPSTYAAIFGLLALGFALYRRRK